MGVYRDPLCLNDRASLGLRGLLRPALLAPDPGAVVASPMEALSDRHFRDL